jgi:hypothetical protein
MELDLPTTVSHPHSRGTCLSSRAAYPPPKIHLQNNKNSLKPLLIKKTKSEEEFDKLTFGNIEFVEHEK